MFASDSKKDWLSYLQGARSLRVAQAPKPVVHDKTWSGHSKKDSMRKFFSESMHKMRDRGSDYATQYAMGATPKPYLQEVFSGPRPKAKVPVILATEEKASRVVRITSPAEFSLSALVALVCGGPVEKVVHHGLLVDIHFLSSSGAQKFMDGTLSNGLFGLNGHRLVVRWTENQPISPVPRYIMDEVKTYHASRVIVLSRPVTKRTATSARKRYPNAAENFSKSWDVEGLKWDFVQFGQVVEVTPMVSSKLSVSIQYSDIRSAMLVMHTLRQKSSLLYAKYSSWQARYWRDLCDRPCPHP